MAEIALVTAPSRTIKTFRDGSKLEFASGRFDSHCVYLTRPHQERYAPRDTEYFGQLGALASRFPGAMLYSDFGEIYMATGKTIDSRVLVLIERIASRYRAEAIEIEILFTILYAGMVAEENKANTRLGKRVKRLGVHQVLVERMDPAEAARYSKGMRWQAISGECEARGF